MVAAPVAKPAAARPAAAAKPVAAQAPAPQPPINVPTLQAAPVAPVAAPPAPAPAAAPPVAAAAKAAPKPAQATSAPVAKSKPKQPVGPGSNVREVLKSLDETGQTQQMPSPPVTRQAVMQPEPTLSDTQALRILEDRRADGTMAPSNDASSGITMLKPDDTSTVRALKEAVQTNQPVSFAVQLQWSVQPIDLNKVPPLAIFSAYTLYTVEGSREGRRWYGLRLGFFSDAISAKQVAYYVRSEFSSVAVVPVSAQERARATEAEKLNPPPSTPPKPKKSTLDTAEEFKLIDDDDTPKASTAPARPQKPAPVQKQAARAASPLPAKRNAKAPVKKTRERRVPQSLEETLEILGADQLEIDNDRGEFLNDTGVRHLRVQVQKNSAFSRLLDKLSERVRS